jgi:hypothetical protein
MARTLAVRTLVILRTLVIRTHAAPTPCDPYKGYLMLEVGNSNLEKSEHLTQVLCHACISYPSAHTA